MKIDNSDLNSCPFCGETPELHRDKKLVSDNNAIIIKCANKECEVQPRKCFDSSFLTHEEIKPFAIKAWNKRI